MVTGLDGCVRVQYGVVVKENARFAWRVERQNNAVVAFDVVQLETPAQMAANRLVAVQADPDDAHLRAPVRVDGGQVGHWAGCDQVPKLVWQDAHKVLLDIRLRVETMGLEPTTPCVQSRCSSH